TRAMEVLSRLVWCDVPASVVVTVIGEIARCAGTGGLIGGQVVDLEAEGNPKGSPAPATGRHEPTGGRPADAAAMLGYIHAHKTGALFRASLRAGGLIAGADADALMRLDAYAESFGLAFQIVDDLLDVEGEPEKLGKATGSDARKGKLTFPAVY